MRAYPRLQRALRLAGPRRLIGRFAGPKILVASVPKAGTNMLRHALHLFPQISMETTLEPLPHQQQLTRIRALKRGFVVSTHMPTSHELDMVLQQKNIKVIFAMRDPRDVCVSLYHYMIAQPIFGNRRAYLLSLPDEKSRIDAVIEGIDAEYPAGQRAYWPSISSLFRERLGWTNNPASCTVNYEDLVGPKGGAQERCRSRQYGRWHYIWALQ